MKQMRVGLSLVWVGILILALVFTVCPACTSTPDLDEIVLYETTKVFTEEEAENIAEVTENRTRILFEETTPFVAGIELGDVLVCNQSVPGAEYGFLERVIEVSDDGKVVEVEPATLEDAIEQGVIVVNQTIPVEDLLNDAMWTTGVQVLQVEGGYDFSYSPAAGVTFDGHLKVTADARVDCEASFWRGLQKFEFVFSPGFEMRASLTVVAGVEWDKSWGPLAKASVRIPIWGPVALDVGIGLVVGTKGEIKAELDASATYERGYEVGFRYDKYASPRWSTISGITGEGTTLGEPSLKGKAEAVVYGGVVLSARVGVSYVLEAGLELELLGNVEGSGEIETPPWKWEYDFESYLSAQLTADLKLLRIAGPSHKFGLWKWPDPPYNLAYGASGRVTTESGDGLAGVTIEFSSGHSSVTTDADGHWWKHLLRGTVTATPQKAGYTFDPPTKTVTGSASDYNFLAKEEVKYRLTVSSTEGGTVKKPGEGTYLYSKGANVKLEATEDAAYNFTNWTGDVDTIDDVKDAETTITMDGNYSITANFKKLDTWCGDGVVQTPNAKGKNETCDPGNPAKNISSVGCPEGQYCFDCTSCLTPTFDWYCGDGIVTPPYEECDPGNPDEGIPPVLCPGGQECINCHCQSGGYVTPEEVLYVGFEAGVKCSFHTYGGYQYVCDGCTVTIHFWAEDISSDGNYPVTNVALMLDGALVYDSGSISTQFFEYTYELEPWCGETIQIEARAVDSHGVEAVATGSVTTPTHP